MDDLISRQAAIDALNKMKIYRPLDSDRYVISDCLNKIVDLPPAQHEIIHCRECKWHRFDKDNIPYCYNIDYGYGWKDDDFCSRAERREVSE